MKASELIQRLNQLIAEHGDLDVTYDGAYGVINEVYRYESQLMGAPPPSFTLDT